MFQFICFAFLMALTVASAETMAPVASPTVSPVSKPPFPGYEPCSVCGEGMTVGFLHRSVTLGNYPELSCQFYQDLGLDGYLSTQQCLGLTSLIFDPCKCIEGSPTPPTMAPVPTSSTMASPNTDPSTASPNTDPTMASPNTDPSTAPASFARDSTVPTWRILLPLAALTQWML